MANLRHRERVFTITAIVLGVISVSMAAYLASPLSPSRYQKASELLELQNEHRSKLRSPYTGVPEKLSHARVDIVKFYRDRVPSRYSTLAEVVGTLARENGITLSSVSYGSKPVKAIDGLTQVLINTNVNGDYSKLAKFITSIEHSKTFFIIDSVALSGQQSGQVGLQISIETYVRSETLDGEDIGDGSAPSKNESTERTPASRRKEKD